MTQSGADVSTVLILVNLRETPEIVPCRLVLGRLKDQEPLEERTVMTNTCNLIQLDGVPSTPDNPICAFSPDMVAVPVYLSYDAGFRHMSLEHTHPPSELMVFGGLDKRFAVVGGMKKYWMGKMFPDAAKAS